MLGPEEGDEEVAPPPTVESELVIDLHNHTVVGSGDSIIAPEQLIQIAKSKGLDGVCITEHGNKRPEGVEELARKYGFVVIGGMEASTELGDILIFGLESFPRVLHRARDLAQHVREQGGAMVAAHPFRYDLSQKPWLRMPLPISVEEACQREFLHMVDAMEVANGWATEEDVEFSREVSRRLSLGGTGGSDAHTPKDIGFCVTVFESEIRDDQDLIRELKTGRFWAEDRRTPEQKSPTHLY